MNRTVAIGLLGTVLDSPGPRGAGPERWQRWRPTVALVQQPDLRIDRLELIEPPSARSLADSVVADVRLVSPETEVVRHAMPLKDPWDFAEVYTALADFADRLRFAPETQYLVHMTTGTHVAQICLFLLVQSRTIPGKLVQLVPPEDRRSADPGSARLIDLDLRSYDRLAGRLERRHQQALAGLTSGIGTANPRMKRLLEQVELVAQTAREPILLLGPTGAGKSQLARRIYELRKARNLVNGPLVELNCATLRGDQAMSALFGHRKGAFTGAATDRPGLLKAADGGVLFLDEIGELGHDEQAMLLRAIEDRRFLPMGADKEVVSDFHLICGTNRDLSAAQAGRPAFRADLLARINVWPFRLPGLAERPEDIEPNVEFELARFANAVGRVVRFSPGAREAYMGFARSPAGRWPGNFRDLSASLTRLATLAGPSGRISEDLVAEEIARLQSQWGAAAVSSPAGPAPVSPAVAPMDADLLHAALGQRAADLDLLERVQLATVLRVCIASGSLAEAGRVLFSASRAKRQAPNDSDRVRKLLARFGLSAADITRLRARGDPAAG
jgi:transcriptional regulatory protein RtcR